MQLKAELMDEIRMDRTISRISHEIIEKNANLEDVILVGIKTRGVPIANQIAEKIFQYEAIKVEVYQLDITLYRDDLTEKYSDATAKSLIDFDVKAKNIILVDDVIYTGRTARCGIDAVLHKDRPTRIQLAVLVDRGHRELPIRADYVGKNVPTSKDESISVKVSDIDGENSVKLYSKQ